MNPSQFIAKWSRNTRSERAASQSHFNDLCAMLGHPTPNDDPTGENMAFEKGVDTNRKGQKGQGWADVWKREHFGWEYKGKHKNLDAALDQLKRYAGALENPPLLVVSDIERIVVHTNFNGYPSVRHEIPLDSLDEPNGLEYLRRVFFDPQVLKPGETIAQITTRAAADFASIAEMMRLRPRDAGGALFLDPLQIARFLDRVVFCLFAEDIGLLPPKVFTQIVGSNLLNPERLARRIGALFAVMATGGDFDEHIIRRFNGSLFGHEPALEMKADEIAILHKACGFQWDQINPSITGTLFERFLDVTGERAPLGAHYTTQADIETLIDPVVLAPLRAEWQQVLAGAKALVEEEKPDEARQQVQTFLQRLGAVRVLDPACGSGNFLYVTLRKLKDLEKEANVFAADHGLGAFETFVRPEQMQGIEKNPYAIDLAQTTLWIGFFQWTRANGYEFPQDPLLHHTGNFHRMDAVLDESDPDDPREPEWPQADFIVGNPPFLGGSRMWEELGRPYQHKLWRIYEGRLTGESDFCCYWFEKARALISEGKVQSAGLIATQGIRGGASREVLKRIKSSGDIFFAESDRDWTVEGANVHVSMVAFDNGTQQERILDGQPVPAINSNLTRGADVTKARSLSENADICFIGTKKAGLFNIPETTALNLLPAPNPHGKPNSDILRPWLNGKAIVQRPTPQWIIDPGTSMKEEDFALYERPYFHVTSFVRPARATNNRAVRRDRWWLHAETAPNMRAALFGLPRFIVTPRVSKFRIFVWAQPQVLADDGAYVFARADDYFFGVLHSRFHEVWALKLGTRLEDRPRYTPESCFLTFPFPRPDAEQTGAIAEAAKTLDAQRERWLNPPEWTREEILEFPGSVEGPWARFVVEPDAEGVGTVRYPRRVLKGDKMPVNYQTRDAAGQEVTSTRMLREEMATRTLTNLYNQPPQWLTNAHRALDQAVAQAYNWSPDLSDEEILENLLALNQARAANS
jgi:hypothetical protein